MAEILDKKEGKLLWEQKTVRPLTVVRKTHYQDEIEGLKSGGFLLIPKSEWETVAKTEKAVKAPTATAYFNSKYKKKENDIIEIKSVVKDGAPAYLIRRK